MDISSFLAENFVSLVPGHFHGGIHPPQHKNISNQIPSNTMCLSSYLVLPLQQHIGHPAVPVVDIGEHVVQGQLIANWASEQSARVHAPTDGIVEAIRPTNLGHPSGLLKPAILLKTSTQEKQTYLQTSQTDNVQTKGWRKVNKTLLIEQIKDAGIVGLGGATFPTNIKLSGETIETLIVNAMECEPYITCDDRMLRELSTEVINGAQIAAYITGAKQIIFAIEDNKPEAIEALIQAIKIYSLNDMVEMQLQIAPTKYPSGGEKQLIELVLNRQLPKGQLPAAIGVMVQNVATLFAIDQAIISHQPLVNRLVTITGDLVNRPGNYWLPFGTPISHIMSQLDIDKDKCQEVIFGGPLMGQSITDFSIPTTKSTNCVIFNHQTKSVHAKAKSHQACIRCSDCEKVCPASLLPQQLYWFSQSEQWNGVENQGLFDCIECGACAYVCPSEIPLVQYFRFAKSSVRNNRIKSENAERAKKRYEFREMRLQRAKDERALKHQQAALARQQAAANKSQDPSGKQTAINQALERVKQKKAALQNKQHSEQVIATKNSSPENQLPENQLPENQLPENQLPEKKSQEKT